MYFVAPHANSVKKVHRTNLVHVVTNIAQALEMDVSDVWKKYLTISIEEYNERLLDKDEPLLWEKYRQHNRRNVLKESADEYAFTVLTNKFLVSGVGIKNKVVRSYPEKRRMAHVVGFVNKVGVGSSGIELKLNSYLKGADGRIEGEKDARQQEIVHRRNMEIPPVAGADVFLTLDHAIQYEAEKALKKALKSFALRVAGQLWGGWRLERFWQWPLFLILNLNTIIMLIQIYGIISQLQ